jgi:hypothetical protein
MQLTSTTPGFCLLAEPGAEGAREFDNVTAWKTHRSCRDRLHLNG